MACSEMSQRYNHIAGGNGISLHNLLFNLALTHPGATGAYLRHAVVGDISQPPAQLRKCRVTIRHATSWLSVGRSLRTPALRSRAPHRPPPGAASAHRLCEQSTSPPTTGRSLRNDGDDDRRRTFLLPREGLQPCVAPYFADLGVGDMRGPPMGTPNCHPGGGGRPSSHHATLRATPIIHSTLHATPWRKRQPRTTSGVRFRWDTTTPSPHVATTQRGEIRGYARRQPPPGLEITSPLVIVSAPAEK